MNWRTKTESSYGAEETPSLTMLKMTHNGVEVPNRSGLLTSEFGETVKAFAKDSGPAVGSSHHASLDRLVFLVNVTLFLQRVG